MKVKKYERFKIGSVFILSRYPAIPEDINPYGYKVASYQKFLKHDYSLRITSFEKGTTGIIIETAEHNHHTMVLALVGMNLYLVDWNFIKIISE